MQREYYSASNSRFRRPSLVRSRSLSDRIYGLFVDYKGLEREPMNLLLNCALQTCEQRHSLPTISVETRKGHAGSSYTEFLIYYKRSSETSEPMSRLNNSPCSAPLMTNKMWRNIACQWVYQLVVLLVMQYQGANIFKLHPVPGVPGHDNGNPKLTCMIFNAFVFCQVGSPQLQRGLCT